MGRRREKKSRTIISSGGWMVTFSDLVTLLLTFFVLLLSMATLDQTIILRAFRQFTLSDEDVGFMTTQTAVQVPTRIEIVAKTLEEPWDVLEKEERIKDLLFPDDELPPDLERSTFEQNLQILKRPEGVAIMMTDSLLFDTAQWVLKPGAEKILKEIAYLLLTISAPVNIAGYTDTVPGRTISNYELSARRALSVLAFMLSQGLPNERFSVSGYGPHFPIKDNTTDEGKAANRRVEILIKTGPGALSNL
ncbi:MAG: OmpA/MotB family protein [Desulfovibrionales bacterium]